MLHDRLIEAVAAHVKLLDEAVDRGVALDNVFELYGVLHALQIHAQAAMDYLLHTCSILGRSVETPLRCVDVLHREGLLGEQDARLLKKMIRFRNIVVHQYGAIDVEKVEKILASRGYREVLRILTTLHTKLKERGAADP